MMTLWQTVAVAAMVWVSGALFGAGFLTLRVTAPRPTLPDAGQPRAHRMNISGALVWWVAAAALAWLALIVVQQIIAS